MPGFARTQPHRKWAPLYVANQVLMTLAIFPDAASKRIVRILPRNVLRLAAASGS